MTSKNKQILESLKKERRIEEELKEKELTVCPYCSEEAVRNGICEKCNADMDELDDNLCRPWW